jgi:hypothetical protein
MYAFCSFVSAGLGGVGKKGSGDIPLTIWRKVNTVRDIRSSGTSWPKVDGSFSGLRLWVNSTLHSDKLVVGMNGKGSELATYHPEASTHRRSLKTYMAAIATVHDDSAIPASRYKPKSM